ncbi:MAG: hydrogenase 3 maturation endopeptidase HyCI [Thermoprotei archaeon]|nr:MAG: hydrogenase 3 maturation endopeptidase HyCI [Thermoprotei archaeon]
MREFREVLSRIIKDRKVVIIGLGHPLRGDDFIGSYIAKKLQQLIKSSNILIINAETVPELYTDVVREFKPDILLIIDAVDFGGKPGEMIFSRLCDLEMVERNGLSHALPLHLVLRLMNIEEDQVYILGIQPGNITVGNSMSQEVLKRAEVIVKIIRDITRNNF